MAQVTSGVRAVLSNAVIYSLFQRIMGAHQGRSTFVKEFVRPYAGMRVLDIGCGPAEILAHLPEVEYEGFDISSAYVERARGHFGQRGRFHCQEITLSDVEQIPPFDVVLAMGLLHHLDDDVAVSIMRIAAKALKPGGRLLTIDPCLEPGQHPIARFLVSHDRGQNVRTRSAYAALASRVFQSPSVEVRHQKWIPYTHCVTECTRR